MPIDYDQMRDCILDALSQHVLAYDRPADMTVSWAVLRRRTQESAIVRGLLGGGDTAFDAAEHKTFDNALWALFSDGILAPLFKSQRYGGKGWEEGEFKLTARGMRGFGGGAPRARDVEAYLASLRPICADLAGSVAVLAFAEQAVRAARAELHLAAAVMARLALDTALAELRGPARAHGADAEELQAIASLGGGLGPLREPDGSFSATIPTAPEVDAGLTTLASCLERANALAARLRSRAAS